MPADDLGGSPHAGPSSHGDDFADEAIDDEDLALVSSPEPLETEHGGDTDVQPGPAASRALQTRQRNRWRRVLFAALPYQVRFNPGRVDDNLFR